MAEALTERLSVGRASTGMSYAVLTSDGSPVRTPTALWQLKPYPKSFIEKSIGYGRFLGG